MKNARIVTAAVGCLFLTSALVGCGGSDPADDPPPAVDAGVLPPPPPPPPPGPPPPPPPPPELYRRASLKPLFQLTPINEQQKFNIFGVVMNNADFQTAGVGTSADQKIRQLSQQIGAELGQDPPNLFIDGENSTRAQNIPFRGNPTDVKVAEIDGIRKAFVPMGGDVTTPGNEIAIVNLDNGNVKRLLVGLHPQRIFVDEANEIAFVCNQFSNYISVIDARFDELLLDGGNAVEIPSDFYCADLAVVQRNPLNGEDRDIDLYVANEYRASVMKYELEVIEDLQGNTATVEVNAPAGQPDYVPAAEITGVGKNPYRLALDDTESRIYVANNRGGEIAAIEISTDSVTGGGPVLLNAPSTDILQIQDRVYVATTTPFRGLLSNNASAINNDVNKPAARRTGVDGVSSVVHTGAKFDQTDSYNFEDLRNGMFTLPLDLRSEVPVYITDDSDADAFFVDAQLQLAGAVPWDIERNANGTQLYAAMFGSDIVQEFNVIAGAQFRLQASGLEFQTRELPTAVALDEANNELIAVTWGGDVLERFNLDDGTLIQEIDLGFANPRYPATTIEAGEYFYSTAKWANDEDKACTSCHVDRLLVDGIGYANGATAPTAYHQVKPNYNLMVTDQFFWNGSFNNNSYASLAFAAQSRTNCELILFALIEGPDTPAAQRIGDPINFTSDATDVQCRPDTANINPLDGLPRNLDGEDFFNVDPNVQTIGQVIAAQKQTAFAAIVASVQDQLNNVGLDLTRDAVSRSMDFYGAGELRMPPNPVRQMKEMQMLAPDISARIDQGEQIFNDVGCDDCHDPRNGYIDDRDHGLGGRWISDFVARYDADPVLLEILPDGVPNAMELTLSTGFTDAEINFQYDPLDYFEPFCFDENLCLRFDNPLTQNGEEEDRRLRRITIVNLADPDRGFVPGQVVGSSRTNTPSLRGVWLQHNLLRHGEALSLEEAILPPGHAALKEGQKGFAMDQFGDIDVHGRTSQLSPDEVESLVWFLRSIE